MAVAVYLFPACLGMTFKIDFAAGDPEPSSAVRFFFFFLQPFSPTWDLAPAPSPSRLRLAEFLQHSNIHISAAEYELCTISSEKEFNDASLVQSASTNEEWFPLS